jgi:hypothetical protein
MSSAPNVTGGERSTVWRIAAVVRERQPAILAIAVTLPLAIAGIVLLWRPWVPVLDMAMTELRVRDVGGSNSPLVGLPGRIGTFPDQGSHPGPWSFYLVTPFYRLSGSRAWGLELASIAINSTAVMATIWLGRRRWGHRGALLLAVACAVLVRGYGLNVLTHPWNPYFPVLLWFLALIAAWLVLAGDHSLAWIVVVTTTIAAQTHVPYLASAIALNVVVIGVTLWRLRTGQAPDGRRPLVLMVGIGAVLWVAPIVEQLRESPGNIARLVRHFATDQPEESIGLGNAGRLVLRHLDVFAILGDLLTNSDGLVDRAGQIDGTSIGGIIVVVAWITSIAYAWRRRHRDLLALHAVAATATIVGWISIARIFGKVWFYLTLWMSSATVLVAIAIAWSAFLALRERDQRFDVQRFQVAGLGAIALLSTLSAVEAFGHQVPERNLGEDVRVIIPDVVQALNDGVGDSAGREIDYVLFFQESVVPGAQGYAVLNELERRGFSVGVHPTWRVPATSHRVRFDGEYGAEIHVVSGAWIDEWRTRPDHVEVVNYDGRTEAERATFERVETIAIARLVEIGREDLLPVVDTNIFGASLDPDLPLDIVEMLGEMLQIGEPVSIFFAPAGSTF